MFVDFGLNLHNYYRVECYRDGKLAWVEDIPNIIVDEGANDLLTKYLKSGTAVPFYVGLVSATGFTALAVGDTASKITATANPPTTNGWQEGTVYSDGARQALTMGTASARSINNSASKAVFHINGTDTIHGVFVVTLATTLGTTGLIYGEAAFVSDRAVLSGDTLNVTVTATA